MAWNVFESKNMIISNSFRMDCNISPLGQILNSMCLVIISNSAQYEPNHSLAPWHEVCSHSLAGTKVHFLEKQIKVYDPTCLVPRASVGSRVQLNFIAGVQTTMWSNVCYGCEMWLVQLCQLTSLAWDLNDTSKSKIITFAKWSLLQEENTVFYTFLTTLLSCCYLLNDQWR